MHDNVFLERFWRSVKYEEVYLMAYESVAQARSSIRRYLDFYNGRRTQCIYRRPWPARCGALSSCLSISTAMPGPAGS